MPWKQDPNLWGIVGTVLLSLASGFIAVASSLAGGQKFSILWATAQLMSAVLVGWLVWDMWPAVQADMPAWLTQPIAVAISSHYGGKIFSIMEKVFTRRFNLPTA